MNMDTIILRDIRLDLAVGLDAWRRPNKSQPVLITINLQPSNNFEAAALKDEVSLTLDYGKLYKSVLANVGSKSYGNIQGLMLDLAKTIEDYKLLNIDIALPKALLQSDQGLHYHMRIDRSAHDVDATWSLAVKGLACSCIVGVNPHERMYKQVVTFDIVLGGTQVLDPLIDANAVADAGIHEMVSDVISRVEGSSYQTLEALATAVAQVATMDHGQPIVTVSVEKPSAIASIGTAAIQITRSRPFFENKDFWKVKRP